MAIDEAAQWAHADRVKLGEAVLDWLGSDKRQDLAQRLGVHPSWVTRLVQGEQTSLTIAQLCAVEDALGAPRGVLFVAAGVIEPALTVEDAVRQDRALTKTGREAVIGTYRALALGKADQ